MTSGLNGPPLALRTEARQTERENADTNGKTRTPAPRHAHSQARFRGDKRIGGWRGRGAAGKTPFVTAVACSVDGRPLAMRMTPLKGFCSDPVKRRARHHLSPDAEVTSDGLQCFRAIVETCPHWSRRE